MSRTRNIYNAETIFVGRSPSTGLHQSSGASGVNYLTQLHRVQSASYSFNVDRKDINQYGQLGRIDAIILDPPKVSLEFTYLLTNVNNESGIGLTVNKGVSVISGFLAETEGDKNYFISIAPEGQDSANFSGSRQTYGFGNGFVSAYSAEGAVGGLPTANVSVEAFNFRAYGASTGASPAINPIDGTSISNAPFSLPTASSGYNSQVSALRPGDISFSLAGVSTLGVDPVDLKIQSFNLSVELARENINALGLLYPTAKPLQVPVNSKIDVEAIVGDAQAGNLNDILCNDAEYNLSITLREPACAPAVGATGIKFDFRGAKLVSQNFSSSIGPNKSVSLSFSAQASGPQDPRGIFVSGRFQ